MHYYYYYFIRKWSWLDQVQSAARINACQIKKVTPHLHFFQGSGIIRSSWLFSWPKKPDENKARSKVSEIWTLIAIDIFRTKSEGRKSKHGRLCLQTYLPVVCSSSSLCRRWHSAQCRIFCKVDKDTDQPWTPRAKIHRMTAVPLWQTMLALKLSKQHSTVW